MPVRSVWPLLSCLVACGGASHHDRSDGGADAGATAPDFRFKWVDASNRSQLYSWNDLADGSYTSESDGAHYWSSVVLGRYTFSAGQLDAGELPEGSSAVALMHLSDPTASFTSTVKAAATAGLDDDLAALLQQGLVLTSLDVSSANFYGVSAIGPQQSQAYAGAQHFAGAAGDLSAWVASEGAAGRVVTALASVGSAVDAWSFPHASDATVYETRMAPATFANLADQASALAGAGFVITAAGRASDGSFILVGTRAQGATRVYQAKALSGPSLAGDSPLVKSVQQELMLGGAIVALAWDELSQNTWIVIER